MSNKNESAGTRIAAGMGGIRGVWLDEAEEAYEAGTAAKAESPLSSFLHSGRAVAAACAVTALGVFAAILAMGRAGGGWGRTPVNPGGNPAGESTVILSTLPDVISEERDNVLTLVWKDCARENIRSDAVVSGSGYMAYMAPPLSRVPVVPTSMDPKDWEPDTSLPEAESPLTEPLLRFPMPAEGDGISFFWESVPTFVSVGVNRIDRKNNVLIPLGCPFKAEQGAESVTLKRGASFPSDTELLLVVSAVWSDSATATYRILLEAWSDDLTKLPADNGLTVFVSAFSENDYRCTLVPGSSPDTLPVPLEAIGCTPEQMRDILAAYDLPADRVRVELYQNRLSSYIWPYMMDTDESGRVLTDGDKLGMKMEIEDTLRDRLGIPLTAEQREERVKQYFPLE